MNIELKKEQLTASQSVLELQTNIPVSGDLIVPDKKPDIDRVLQVDGRAIITHRDASGGKITVGGIAEFTVLYTPLDRTAPLRSINISLPFRDIFETECTERDIRVSADADICSIDFSVINSRKLNISAMVTLCIKAYRQQANEVVCDIEGDFPIEINRRTLKIYSVSAECESTLTLPEKIEIPSSAPPIAEVLKIDASVTCQDVKVLPDKAVVKGYATAKILYLTADADNPVKFMEQDIPFTEILDLPGITENMDCEVDCLVGNIYYETDDDRQSSILGVEITVNLHARGVSSASVEVPDDCYSTTCNITPCRKERILEYLAATEKRHVTLRGNIALPEGCPQITELYTATAKPVIEHTQMSDSEITICGRLDTTLIYMTPDPDLPLYSFRGEIPFEICSDMPTLPDRVELECDIHLTNCGYTVPDSRSAEIRANTDVFIKVIGKETLSLIDELSISDDYTASRPPVIIYFIKPGDTLWNISKHYKTTTDTIIQTNGLDPASPLVPGTPLII